MSGDVVRIATWNCFGAPTNADDFFAGRPFWPERLDAREVVETLAAYDVVCVQENLVSGVCERLERLREAAKFAALWFDPMGPDAEGATFVGGGLALLSRFPIRATFERLSRGAGPDGFARKGFAVAKVEARPGVELTIVNTHLQADDDNVPAGACRDARARQIAELGAATRTLSALGPTFVCGDLNVPHAGDEFATVARAFGEELCDTAARTSLATYDVERNDLAATFHGGGPRRTRLDYVFAPRRLEVLDVRALLDAPLADVANRPSGYAGRPVSSDHFGIGVTLRLP
ncbi:MAG TPA: endonuclease/exonuclease/phosphatase family protein [Minicystis sp.]|nr:endonuclease/exonuclease/phosphatase family protein [Minicystis sp.]